MISNSVGELEYLEGRRWLLEKKRLGRTEGSLATFNI